MMNKQLRLCWIGMILVASGCQTMTKKKEQLVTSPTPKASSKNALASYNPIAKLTGQNLPKGSPESIVAIWKDATYTVANQRPTRGFGGRLYFYDREKNPVVVDGELVIYGFMDSKYDPQKRPEKRFIFSREELPGHMSVSSVGPSYSVWLPWDHINGEQKSVTIIAVFKEAGPNGRVCKSEAIPALLPGTKPALEEATETLIERIRKEETLRSHEKQVGFQETKPEGTKKIRTHEIRIPESSRQRLFGSVPTAEYRLPTPQVKQVSAESEFSNQTSATQSSGQNNRSVSAGYQAEPTSSTAQPQSANSSPGQRQVRTGQFLRQGKLPPGKKPPRLGATSYPATPR